MSTLICILLNSRNIKALDRNNNLFNSSNNNLINSFNKCLLNNSSNNNLITHSNSSLTNNNFSKILVLFKAIHHKIHSLNNFNNNNHFNSLNSLKTSDKEIVTRCHNKTQELIMLNKIVVTLPYL